MFGKINNDHVMGAMVGVGACAVGYYLYQKNEDQVNTFLKKQGLNVPALPGKNYNTMNMEELMETKELIEDLIAEKEVRILSEVEIPEEEI